MKAPLLGAHTSIAGGVAASIPRAIAVGFTASQIFVKNNQQWMGPALSTPEIREFRDSQEKSGLFVFGHAGYLINPGSAKEENRKKSVDSLEHELLRADALGLPFLVLHPGSHGGDGEEVGLQRIADSLNEVLSRTPKVKTRIALENTAGSGNSIGGKFEHLRCILDHVKTPDRFGVCIDTAHLLESGFPIHTREGFDLTFQQFEKLIGLEWLLAFHVNDSKTKLGSRVDRHEHLGKGHVGLEPFRWLMQEKKWAKIPKVLETPKEEAMLEDIENLNLLRSFL